MSGDEEVDDGGEDGWEDGDILDEVVAGLDLLRVIRRRT